MISSWTRILFRQVSYRVHTTYTRVSIRIRVKVGRHDNPAHSWTNSTNQNPFQTLHLTWGLPQAMGYMGMCPHVRPTRVQTRVPMKLGLEEFGSIQDLN